MDPATIAAIIGGVSTLGAASINAIANQRGKNLAAQHQTQQALEAATEKDEQSEDPMATYDPTQESQTRQMQDYYRNQAFKNMWGA